MRRVVMKGMLRRFERLPGCHHLVVGQRHALHAPTNLFFFNNNLYLSKYQTIP
jgi:hypothetical protein